MLNASLRLFKAIPIKHQDETPGAKIYTDKGLILPNTVFKEFTEEKLLNSINGILLVGDKLNKSFHKSWAKVANTPIEDLIREQLINYFTVYGLEALGLYNENYVYLPKEALEVPDLETYKFLYVGPISYENLKKRTLSLLSGMALKPETIADAITILKEVGFTAEDFAKVKNKEAYALLIDKFNLLPKDAVEFLRYLVLKSTGETLLIKSKKAVAMLKVSGKEDIPALMAKYEKLYGLAPLAATFLRFKPLFLALKNESTSHTINRIRRLATTAHKPMVQAPLNLITGRIKKGDPIADFDESLRTGSIFQKIRLAYALKYRTLDSSAIVYKVRNGKSWVDDFVSNHQEEADAFLDRTLANIASLLPVSGKKVYIPSGMEYALPATEKQFMGMFPIGTRINIDANCVVGVYWKDTPEGRVDLDLSAQNLDPNSRVGWNRNYRSDGGDVLFSGDMTSAPKGATELIFFRNDIDKSFALFVNMFSAGGNVPFDILIARHEGGLDRNYMVSPNDLIASIPSVLDQDMKNKGLGFYVCKDGKSSFLLMENDAGNSRIASVGGMHDKMFAHMETSMSNVISFNDLLVKAGAIMVDKAEEADINLAPDALTKDSFLKLLTV